MDMFIKKHEFDRIFTINISFFRKFAYKYVKQGSDDLVNDLYEHSYKNLNKFDYVNDSATLDISVKKWLVRILKNLCLNHIKSKKNVVELSDFFHDIYDSESYSDKYCIIVINIFFDNLDYNHSVVMVYYYFLGYTSERISRVMDLPDGTVKSRISWSKIKLGNVIKRFKIEPI